MQRKPSEVLRSVKREDTRQVVVKLRLEKEL